MTAESTSEPRPPAGLKAAGRRLWDSVVGPYDLDEHERALLAEAVRTVDLLHDLDAEVRRDGVTIETPQGLRAHPAAVEARQQRIALARLLAVLRLPQGEEGDRQAGARQGRQGRPQRRAGARGAYGIRGAVS